MNIAFPTSQGNMLRTAGYLWDLLAEVKRSKREADISLPSTAETKNRGSTRTRTLPHRSSWLGASLTANEDTCTSRVVPF
jgi:hypothetical protein